MSHLRHRRCDLYAISRWDVAAMSKSATILGSQQYRRDIAGATYVRYRGGTSQRHRRCNLCALSRCDVAATSHLRHRRCDLCAILRCDVAATLHLRHRRDIAGATYMRYRGGTSQRHRRCDLCAISRCDVAATSQVRHRRDIAGATYVRYRGATSQRCRKVQQYWGRSDVAATLTKVAATSLRHKCDMKFLTGYILYLYFLTWCDLKVFII